MSGFARRIICSFPMISAVMLATFIAPSSANAELLLQLHDAWATPPVPEVSRQTVKRQTDISLNENGDLMIRRSEVSLTMAYNPPNEIIDPKERLRIAQRLDCPTISGISLKLSLPF